MSKLYSLKKFVGSITTGMAFVWALLCVQPLKAQPDSLRPDIRFFTPTSGSQGTLIDIVGTNFIAPANVFFGGTPAASVQVLSDSLIRAKVGAGSTGAVTVITQFGGDSLGGFTFIRDTARPRIRSFTPTSGRTGTTVFIFGKHFTGATSVSFGNVPALSYVVFADTGIRAVVGNGASGAVRVKTPFGIDSLNGFTFIRDTTARPKIAFFTPTSGNKGTIVEIIGKGFKQTVGVRFGGVPATLFAVLSDTLIWAKVGNGASGFVSVSTPTGTDSLCCFKFVSQLPIVINERIGVAPNPSNGYAIVTHPAIAENAQLKITDVAGNVVRTIRVSPNVSQTQLSLGGVKPGVYKLSWGDGAKWISQTLLVQ